MDPYLVAAVPEEVEELVGDLRAAGTCAYAASTLQDVCEHVVDSSESGDVVVLMSNGEFGRLHSEILGRLGNTLEQSSDSPG